MGQMRIGVRLHDYGRGTPCEMFEKIAGDGFCCTQLAFRKAISGVTSYEDVTPELVRETKKAAQAAGIEIAVLGTYVELAMNDDAERRKNTADFISQLEVCSQLGSVCIGTETTSMEKQPPGTSRERALYQLCRSLDEIMPHAEALGVKVGIEPVSYHSMNTPETTRWVLDTIRSPNLMVIFDPANLLSADQVKNQKQLWYRTGELLGDRIAAVHFKGVIFDAQGKPVSSDPKESVVDYAGAFVMLHQLKQCLPVLREEAIPSKAAADQALIRSYIIE